MSVAPPAAIAGALPEAAAFLRDPGPLMITSHVNSDGDGVAGGLALAALARQLGSAPAIVLQDVPVGDYAFLAGWEDVTETAAAPAPSYPRGAVLDCPNLARAGEAAAFFADGAPLLNIDHHRGNEAFGAVNLASDEVCSTCEMIYHLAVHLDLDIDRDIAEQLYTGILFDTGGFRYSLTTPTSMEVGADLVRRGARLDRIADRLYNSATYDDVRIIGCAIDSMRLHADERVAIMNLTLQDLERGDPESAVNYGLRIRGVEVSALLKQVQLGRFRVSLRSREAVDVAAVARGFAGGGHARAAGCSIDGNLESTRAKVLDAILGALP